MGDYVTIAPAMSAAVLIRIQELKKNGGPSSSDWEKMGEFGEVLAAKGDILLFGGGKKGEQADLFNRTAHAISVLAFVPGGITIFGEHWEAK